jgi:hypothetical protein
VAELNELRQAAGLERRSFTVAASHRISSRHIDPSIDDGIVSLEVEWCAIGVTNDPGSVKPMNWDRLPDSAA